MNEQMNKQWSNGRYKRENQIRPSLLDFIILVRQYVVAVVHSQEGIQRIYEIFSDQDKICSDECDELLTSLHIMNTAVHDLYKVFEDFERLPSVIIPLRLQLVTELCTAKERIRKLALLAKAFRSTHWVISGQVIRQHYTIICSLEALLRVSENIILCPQFLFDQARFLEQS